MNLSHLKLRTIHLLDHIESEYFKVAIDKINNITARDDSGFEDILAKARVIHTALHALMDRSYHLTIEDPQRLYLFNAIYEDGESFSLPATHQSINPKDFNRDKIVKFKDARRLLEKLDAFMVKSNSLSTIYANRRKHYSFEKKTADWQGFSRLSKIHDSEQDWQVIGFDLAEAKRIGTLGLGCCIAVYVSFKTKNNKIVAAVGHFSSISSGMIEEVIEDLETKYDKPPESSTNVYLAGGSIHSLDDAIDVISCTELGIDDMRLCVSDGSLDEGSALLASWEHPNKLFYICEESNNIDCYKRKIESPATTPAPKRQRLTIFGASSTTPLDSLPIQEMVARPSLKH